jgi:hypothetical protein
MSEKIDITAYGREELSYKFLHEEGFNKIWNRAIKNKSFEPVQNAADENFHYTAEQMQELKGDFTEEEPEQYEDESTDTEEKFTPHIKLLSKILDSEKAKRPNHSRKNLLQSVLCQYYSGNTNVIARQQLLNELTGKTPPKAKAGIHRIEEEFLKYEDENEHKKIDSFTITKK